MKRFLNMMICSFMLAMSASTVFAASYNASTNWFDTTIVSHIDVIGKNILKANNMPTTVTFKVTDNSGMNSDISSATETIYIYSGNLKQVENDNELAAMIAHELGHIVNGHNAKTTLLNSAIASINPQTTTEGGANTVSLLKIISSNKVLKSNENEADITAVDLLMNAKYNPLALISVVYKADVNETGGLLDDNLSCEERIMYIYDYANYNYPAKVKENYKTESYQKALNLINANLDIRNQSKSKVAKANKTQEKLKKDKLKRVRNMAKSTNPWTAAYGMIQLSTVAK